ncbi:MAG: hypothetical protein KAW92_12160, partial [Candidatus Cloacimonetes bacterium]|nr:hypothetical protein [Candidatus Cloacimonadota bacterium]
AFMKKSALAVDFAPDFSLNVKNYYDALDDKINEQVDSVIVDMKAPGLVPIYPDVEILGGQIGGVNGIAASISKEKYGSWGIAFHKPLMLDLDILGNGFSVIITDSTIKNEGEADEYIERTIVPLGIEFFGKLNLDFNQVDFGYGRKLGNNLSFGIGMSSLTCNIDANLTAKLDGIIRQTGGATDINVAFEDPNVEYRNTLNDTVRIDFHKNLVGGKFALSYRPYKWLYLDAVYNMPRKEDFEGSLRIVQHTLGALNLDYDEDAGEELLDIELLKPAQIAYTNRTIYESNTLEFSYPGSFGVSAGATAGSWKFILSYEKPLGELSFHYECDVFEDGIKKVESEFINYADTTYKSYTVGLKMKHNAKIAIGVGRFALSGQVIIADQVLEGVKDADGEPIEPEENIIFGSAAIGFGFHLFRNLAMDINLLALPCPLLRSTLTYKF